MWRKKDPRPSAVEMEKRKLRPIFMKGIITECVLSTQRSSILERFQPIYIITFLVIENFRFIPNLCQWTCTETGVIRRLFNLPVWFQFIVNKMNIFLSRHKSQSVWICLRDLLETDKFRRRKKKEKKKPSEKSNIDS